mmetsp:Transcript_25819/g.32949  ORF Transcript_25819/g.32949 Transcript_25819/m.32949 type:complete len:80 (+) Transcript_25819:273-512(+)
MENNTIKTNAGKHPKQTNFKTYHGTSNGGDVTLHSYQWFPSMYVHKELYAVIEQTLSLYSSVEATMRIDLVPCCPRVTI